jgi:ankyrin repeat protein
MTPLGYAVRGGDPLIVDSILAHGADANGGDTSERPRERSKDSLEAETRKPLCLAMANDRADSIKIVASLVASGAKIDGPISPVSCAGHGQAGKVRFLIARGANPNGTNQQGQPLLVGFAERGDGETVRALLENGADPNATESSGTTALIAAARHAKADTVWVLLAGGADPRRRDSGGHTALDVVKLALAGKQGRVADELKHTGLILEATE